MVPEKSELARNIGFLVAMTLGDGTMIGAGIFILPGIAAANAGPASAQYHRGEARPQVLALNIIKVPVQTSLEQNLQFESRSNRQTGTV